MVLGDERQAAKVFGSLRQIEVKKKKVVAAKKTKPVVPLGFGMLP